MFDLVNNVEAYPVFMPGCVGAEVYEQTESLMVARLDLSKAGIKQSFVTRNTLVEPESISVVLEEGPFSALRGMWEFKALGRDACKISFWLEFSSTNSLLGLAAGKLFEGVASSQVDAICQRADQLYQ